MQKSMYDICNDFYEHINKVQKQIYVAQVGCGRRECTECEYWTLCGILFDLEVELSSIVNDEEYNESED